jgi:sialic acid synthase SpsE
MEKAFIIAEAGTAHGGSEEVAIQMVRAAKSVGADAVKFQVWSKPFVKPDDPFYNFFEKRKLSADQWRAVSATAKDIGIEFMASTFDVDAVDFLQGLGVKRWKVASRTTKDNPELLFYILQQPGEVYVSVGMGIGQLGSILDNVGTDRAKVTVMHCVSKYPTPDSEASLGNIQQLKEYTGKVGYSDHTRGIVACLVARALGATVIEKHFIVPGCDPCHPDASCSADMNEFEKLVFNIRRVEAML